MAVTTGPPRLTLVSPLLWSHPSVLPRERSLLCRPQHSRDVACNTHTTAVWLLRWVVSCINLPGPRGPGRASVLQGSAREFPSKASVCIGGLGDTEGQASPSSGGPECIGERRKKTLSLLDSCPPASIGTVHLICSSPHAGTHTRASPRSQAFGLGLNYTTRFPGSPEREGEREREFLGGQ